MSTYGEDEDISISNLIAGVEEDKILSLVGATRSGEPEMAQVTQASGETIATRSSFLQRFCWDSCNLGSSNKKSESDGEELGEHDDKLLDC